MYYEIILFKSFFNESKHLKSIDCQNTLIYLCINVKKLLYNLFIHYNLGIMCKTVKSLYSYLKLKPNLNESVILHNLIHKNVDVIEISTRSVKVLKKPISIVLLVGC